MTRKATLSDLRNGIQEIYRELMREQGDGAVPNSAVLERVKVAFSKEIEALTPEIVNLALTKLLNDVSNRRGRGIRSSSGFGLFGEYAVPSAVTIIRGSKKDTAKLSFREAKLYLEAHSKKSVSDRHDEFRRMIEEFRDYVKSEEDTLEILIERKRNAEGLALRKVTLLIPA